ncbi:hypothetical protein [Actinoplanes auranticolor]|uniref:Uncharacterized protein n=1 Tax=Actinoplanes auranticolor TaxID=47988 RepID=A0A919SEU0_9ACTN|nr:hypothetical protein [Actinoplanes auranticolor]GIM71370.1 hypothetical protein Aau02nite_45680 [Actinoplanes auranticolor]
MVDACTLPAAARPLRPAEFDSLFATGLRDQQRLSPPAWRWRLDLAAPDLTGRETSCCSVSHRCLRPDRDAVSLGVCVPAAHVVVLDVLAGRAVTGTRRSHCCGRVVGVHDRTQAFDQQLEDRIDDQRSEAVATASTARHGCRRVKQVSGGDQQDEFALPRSPPCHDCATWVQM